MMRESLGQNEPRPVGLVSQSRKVPNARFPRRTRKEDRETDKQDSSKLRRNSTSIALEVSNFRKFD